MKVFHFTKNSSVAYMIGALILAFTLILWWIAFTSLQRYDLARFQNERDRVLHEINARVETYVNALTQTRSMFYVSDEVDRGEFATYIHQLNILQKYPGIQGIGFTKRLSFSEILQHEQEVRKEGILDYNVWPRHLRDEVFSIVFLEPLDWRNRRALGYDMYSQPVRRRAMDKAWDTNLAAMSGPVQLVQETETDKQTGFLIYVPVYKLGAPIASKEERRQNLVGFVYSPFRSKDLFRQIMAPLKDLKIDVEVSLREDGQETRIFDLHPNYDNPAGPLNWEGELIFAQLPWVIHIHALEDFREKTLFYLPFVILGLGIILSVFVTYNLLQNIARNAELAQAVAMRDEFLNIASHELKTPITAMKLQSEVALKMIEKGIDKVYERSDVERRVRGTLKQLDRMIKLIEDMLDSTRLSLGKLQLNQQRFNLTEHLKEFIDRLTEQVESEAIELTTKIPEKDVFVLGDEYRLEQILNNLFNNALKYGAKKPIEIEMKVLEQKVLVSVRDHGIGIPPESLSTIFDRYERASTARNISGLGLGLYISQKIAEAHGGKITVESQVGIGTTFTLQLPLLDTSA